MRVLLLDCDMNIDAATASFDSTHSLYDYDMVLWDPHSSMQSYLKTAFGSTATFEGLPRISNHESPRLRSAIARRTYDFDEFLKLGRTLVVFLPGDMRVYADTGERTFSGTGRNRQTTNLVAEVNILEALPKRPIRAVTQGEDMEPAHTSVGPLYRHTSDYWRYACVFDASSEFQPLFRVKGTDKLTAASTNHSSGTLVFLPVLLTDTDDEGDIDVDDARSDVSEIVTDSADKQPPSESLDSDVVDKMVLDWLVAFTSTEEVVWPGWTTEYRFQSEVDRAPKISQLHEQIAKIQAELDTLSMEQEADKRWKLLVVGTGTPFEEAVAFALSQLGFELQPTVPGRTDLRGTRGDLSIVVETKGVTKSGAESHCAQLEKWVAEDLEAGRKSKGILIINSYLNQPPLQRTKPTFPNQMRRYAQLREHCLVSGIQLLNLARTASGTPDRTDELAQLLTTTTGVVDGWDDPTEVFSDTPTPSSPSRRP